MDTGVDWPAAASAALRDAAAISKSIGAAVGHALPVILPYAKAALLTGGALLRSGLLAVVRAASVLVVGLAGLAGLMSSCLPLAAPLLRSVAWAAAYPVARLWGAVAVVVAPAVQLSALVWYWVGAAMGFLFLFEVSRMCFTVL